MTFIASGNPVDVASQTRDIVAMLADLTSNCSGMSPQMSENGWSGFCLLLLMVETELSKLTDRLEGNPPIPFEEDKC